MCVLMKAMRPLIDANALDLTIFIPVRHPLEVARSLQTAQGTSLQQGLVLWIAHVLEAERYTRDLPRMIIDFRDLMQHPDAVLDRCRVLLGTTSFQAGDLSGQAAGFIDPNLQRQRADIVDESEDCDLAKPLGLALEISRTILGKCADDSSLHQALDELHGACRQGKDFMPVGEPSG